VRRGGQARRPDCLVGLARRGLPVRVASQAVCRGDPARRPGWPAGLAGVLPVAKLARLFALGQSHLAFMIRKDLGCSRPKNAYGS